MTKLSAIREHKNNLPYEPRDTVNVFSEEMLEILENVFGESVGVRLAGYHSHGVAGAVRLIGQQEIAEKAKKLQPRAGALMLIAPDANLWKEVRAATGIKKIDVMYPTRNSMGVGCELKDHERRSKFLAHLTEKGMSEEVRSTIQVVYQNPRLVAGYSDGLTFGLDGVVCTWWFCSVQDFRAKPLCSIEVVLSSFTSGYWYGWEAQSAFPNAIIYDLTAVEPVAQDIANVQYGTFSDTTEVYHKEAGASCWVVRKPLLKRGLICSLSDYEVNWCVKNKLESYGQTYKTDLSYVADKMAYDLEAVGDGSHVYIRTICPGDKTIERSFKLDVWFLQDLRLRTLGGRPVLMLEQDFQTFARYINMEGVTKFDDAYSRVCETLNTRNVFSILRLRNRLGAEDFATLSFWITIRALADRDAGKAMNQLRNKNWINQTVRKWVLPTWFKCVGVLPFVYTVSERRAAVLKQHPSAFDSNSGAHKRSIVVSPKRKSFLSDNWELCDDAPDGKCFLYALKYAGVLPSYWFLRKGKIVESDFEGLEKDVVERVAGAFGVRVVTRESNARGTSDVFWFMQKITETQWHIQTYVNCNFKSFSKFKQSTEHKKIHCPDCYSNLEEKRGECATQKVMRAIYGAQGLEYGWSCEAWRVHLLGEERRAKVFENCARKLVTDEYSKRERAALAAQNMQFGAGKYLLESRRLAAENLRVTKLECKRDLEQFGRDSQEFRARYCEKLKMEKIHLEAVEEHQKYLRKFLVDDREAGFDDLPNDTLETFLQQGGDEQRYAQATQPAAELPRVEQRVVGEVEAVVERIDAILDHRELELAQADVLKSRGKAPARVTEFLQGRRLVRRKKYYSCDYPQLVGACAYACDEHAVLQPGELIVGAGVPEEKRCMLLRDWRRILKDLIRSASAEWFVKDKQGNFVPSFHASLLQKICRNFGITLTKRVDLSDTDGLVESLMVHLLEQLERVRFRGVRIEGAAGSGKSYASKLTALGNADHMKFDVVGITETKNNCANLAELFGKDNAFTQEKAFAKNAYGGRTIVLDECYRYGASRFLLYACAAGRKEYNVVFNGERIQNGAYDLEYNEFPKLETVYLNTSYTCCPHFAKLVTPLRGPELYGCAECGTKVYLYDFDQALPEAPPGGGSFSNLLAHSAMGTASPGCQGSRYEWLGIEIKFGVVRQAVVDTFGDQLVQRWPHLYVLFTRLRCGRNSELHVKAIHADDYAPLLRFFGRREGDKVQGFNICGIEDTVEQESISDHEAGEPHLSESDGEDSNTESSDSDSEDDGLSDNYETYETLGTAHHYYHTQNVAQTQDVRFQVATQVDPQQMGEGNQARVRNVQEALEVQLARQTPNMEVAIRESSEQVARGDKMGAVDGIAVQQNLKTQVGGLADLNEVELGFSKHQTIGGRTTLVTKNADVLGVVRKSRISGNVIEKPGVNVLAGELGIVEQSLYHHPNFVSVGKTDSRYNSLKFRFDRVVASEYLRTFSDCFGLPGFERASILPEIKKLAEKIDFDITYALGELDNLKDRKVTMLGFTTDQIGITQRASDGPYEIYTFLKRATSECYPSRQARGSVPDLYNFDPGQQFEMAKFCLDSLSKVLGVKCAKRSFEEALKCALAISDTKILIKTTSVRMTGAGSLGTSEYNMVMSTDYGELEESDFTNLSAERLLCEGQSGVTKTQIKLKGRTFYELAVSGFDELKGGQTVQSQTRERIYLLDERVVARLLPMALKVYFNVEAARKVSFSAMAGSSVPAAIHEFVQNSQNACYYREGDVTAMDTTYYPAVKFFAVELVVRVFGEEVREVFTDLFTSVLQRNRVRTRKTRTKFDFEWKLPSGNWVTLDLNTTKILVDFLVGYVYNFTTLEQFGSFKIRNDLFVVQKWNLNSLRAAILQGDDSVFAATESFPQSVTESGAYFTGFKIKDSQPGRHVVLDFCHTLFRPDLKNFEYCYDHTRTLMKILARKYKFGDEYRAEVCKSLNAHAVSVRDALGGLDCHNFAAAATLISDRYGIDPMISIGLMQQIFGFGALGGKVAYTHLVKVAVRNADFYD